MRVPNISSTGILAGVAVVSVSLVTLAIFQPKIGVLIAESIQAETGTTLDAVTPLRLAEGTKRRPVNLAAEWGRTLSPGKEIQESQR